MTEKATEQQAPPSTNPRKTSLWTDLGPVIAYVIAFNIALRFYEPDKALYIGAAAFGVAMIGALLYAKLVLKHIPPLLYISAIFVIGGALITIGFQNPLVFKMKPTVLNLLFGGAILGFLWRGVNVFKMMMGAHYQLPDNVWRILAIRWGVFFFFLAGLNEVIWRNTSLEFWSNFKLFGMFPITMAFALFNMPLLLKYMKAPEKEAKRAVKPPVD